MLFGLESEHCQRHSSVLRREERCSVRNVTPTAEENGRWRAEHAGGQLSPTAPPPSEAGTFRVGKGRERLI